MDPLTLFFAFSWSFIGFGFFLYGKKRKRTVPLIGGILIMGVTYFARTPLSLSLSGIAIMLGIYVLSKRY